MNCLKNANIRTLRDLVARSEKEMVEIRNFGEKSLKEVREKLEALPLQMNRLGRGVRLGDVATIAVERVYDCGRSWLDEQPAAASGPQGTP